MLTFWGESLNKIDSKGRVSIPPDYRSVLRAGDPACEEGRNPRMLVNYGLPNQNHLKCYTIEAAQGIVTKVKAMPMGSKERKWAERALIAASQTVSIDETGRLSLTQVLRDKIGVADQVYFSSAIDSFQIWNKDTYDSVVARETESLLEEMPEDFDPLQLLEGGGL